MINTAWIAQKRNLLSLTSPGPARDALEAEVLAAEAQNAKEQERLEEAKGAGFIRNKFAGICSVTGNRVREMTGFVRKEGAKWVCYCEAAALEIARNPSAPAPAPPIATPKRQAPPGWAPCGYPGCHWTLCDDCDGKGANGRRRVGAWRY